MPPGPIKVDDAKISPPKRSEMKVSYQWKRFVYSCWFTSFCFFYLFITAIGRVIICHFGIVYCCFIIALSKVIRLRHVCFYQNFLYEQLYVNRTPWNHWYITSNCTQKVTKYLQEQLILQLKHLRYTLHISHTSTSTENIVQFWDSC